MQAKHNHFPNNSTTTTDTPPPPPPIFAEIFVPRLIERAETRKEGIAEKERGVPPFQTRTQAYPSGPFLYFLT